MICGLKHGPKDVILCSVLAVYLNTQESYVAKLIEKALGAVACRWFMSALASSGKSRSAGWCLVVRLVRCPSSSFCIIWSIHNYFITIIWDNEISSLDFNWAVFQGDIIVTMYDVDDNLLGTSSYLSAATNGVGTISSARIRKVTWFGTPNAMGLDSLTWTTTDVPEPSTLAIFALSIMGLASRRFKKQ